jgi:hypothetical protein
VAVFSTGSSVYLCYTSVEKVRERLSVSKTEVLCGVCTLLGGAVTSASSNYKARWSKSKLRHSSLVPLPTGIINLMSSSLSSLAVRCLTRGELNKAKQVTKVSVCMRLMLIKRSCWTIWDLRK